MTPIRLLSVLLITVSLTAPGGSAGAAEIEPHRPGPRRMALRLADVDRRPTQGQPAPEENDQAAPGRAAAGRELARLVPGVQIKTGGLHRGPRWIVAREGYLSGPDGRGGGISDAARNAQRHDDPHRVVKAFVNGQAALFGFGAAALDAARIERDTRSPRSRMHSVVWQQMHEGLPICGASFVAHTSRNEELIAVSSQFFPTPGQARFDRPANRLSIEEAVARAAVDIGESAMRPADCVVGEFIPGRPERRQVSSRYLRGEGMAQLAWLPWDAGSLRLVWEIWLSSHTHGDGYQIMLDAGTGEILRRVAVTVEATPASYRVFTGDSPQPLSPGLTEPGSPFVVPQAVRSLQILTSVDATASPAGWIPDGANTLAGNNVSVYRIMWTPVGNGYSGGPDTVSGSPSRVFDRAYNAALLPPEDPYLEGANDRAAMVNLFYWCNWMHDKLYALGFTETDGNFQTNNFGRGGLGSDRIIGEAQEVSTVNNASFTPAPEGTACRISMGRWMGSGSRRDSSFDAEVILHEYTHGLSQRLVGDGSGALSALQSKGLGEGWSDFFSLSLLSQSGDSLNGNYAHGAYAASAYYRNGGGWGFEAPSDSYYFGTRRYPYTTNMAKNPLTFKDIDPTRADRHVGVPVSPLWIGAEANEVHFQGEVWCAALWDARAQFIQRYGFGAGNQAMLELVMEGMRLTPDDPEFLEARDAILTADQNLNGGANRSLLWSAFARRGLGWLASAPASTNTIGVTENFDVPDDYVVQPAAGLTLRGPVGGPFPSLSRVYSLTRLSVNTVVWVARADAPLQASVGTGILSTPGEVDTVTISLNAQLAAQLPAGVYNPAVTFSNTLSHVVVRRPFRLLVGVDYSTEEFKNAAGARFDLANTSLTFTLRSSDNSYALCQTPAAAFPVDPAGGQFLADDEDCHLVTLGAGRTIRHPAGLFSAATIHKDGSVTLGEGCSLFPSLSAHFSYPRISPFLRLQYPVSSNRISWLELGDRLVVTWNGMRTYSPSGTNSYQAELFYNGNVRMTWRSMGTPNAVVGVSRGSESASDFEPLDLSDAGDCASTLSLELPAAGAEGDGTLPASGRVAVPLPRPSPLAVSLFTDNPNKLGVPASVLIPAGASSTTFPVTIVDNTLLDGSQTAVVTASAGGFTDAHASILVHDNESVALGVTLATNSVPEGSVVSGSVTVPRPVEDDVVVRLSSSRPAEVSFFSPLAFIPKGQTSGDFLLAVFDDRAIQGSRQAQVMASVVNWIPGSANLTVLDNERTNLIVLGIYQLSEGSGVVQNGGRVYLSGTVPTNVTVTLSTSDTTELRVPPSVVIPAGSTNAYFDLTYIDDDLLGDSPLVTINASAPGFGSQFDVVFVLDNDGPVAPFDPQPPDQAENVPRAIDLTWSRSDGDLIRNGAFEAGLAAWTRQDVGAGGWVANDGTFDPESSDGPLPPRGGAGGSALSHQSGNGHHVLYQDLTVPPNAATVVLSWWDRIRNHAGRFDSRQQFRVELRNPLNDTLLAVVFRTAPGDVLFQDWTFRTVDMNPWRGREIRLAFVEDDEPGYLNVHLDDVRVVATAGVSTLYEVYFGTTNELGAAHLLGSTTNSSWTLPTLLPETTYYWKIYARRDAILSVSPVWQFTTAGQSNQLVLVAANTTWRYLANGVYPGATWVDAGYDDRAWPQGAAKLGYGGDGETTVIGSSANDQVTYWFRRKFTVTDPSRLIGLTARLVRDDGAAVYLNGTLVWSDNLPRPFDATSQALTILNAPEETTPIERTFPPSRLVPGQNVVAVEVHQRHGTLANSPDLGFALELVADYDGANPPPAIAWVQPAAFALVKAPANVTLAVDTLDFDGNGSTTAVTRVEFFANGLKLGEDLAAPFALTWAAPSPGEYALRAVATDAGGLRATTEVRHVTINAALPNLTLIPRGSVWRYADAGVDLGTNWIDPKFPDRDWAHGPAQLGYGDGDEATLLRAGLDPLFKPITAYFRQWFVSPADLGSFTLRILRDDGVVVYLDGREIFRNNLPAGVIESDTLAASDVSGGDESIFLTVTLNGPLSAGEHLLAAEVHQSSPSSSDLSFDLELTGVANPRPEVSLTSPTSGARLVPASLLLSAAATDPYGAVANVQFLRNGTSLGAASAPPYQLTWSAPPTGTHTLTAVATDHLGASRTSAPVALTLVAPVTLGIRRQGPTAVLSWPSSISGYHLEASSNLPPDAVWAPLNVPVNQINGKFEASVDATTGWRYYRLRAP